MQKDEACDDSSKQKLTAPKVVQFNIVGCVSRYQVIYSVIRRIPRGRVATYGQIATLAGIDGHARQVGYALHALPSGADVPWHRVVNSFGEVSRRSDSDSD